MGFKHTLKVIVTTIIIIILGLMAGYAFIYRNEISQKITNIANKARGDEKVEKITVPIQNPPDVANNSTDVSTDKNFGKVDKADRERVEKTDKRNLANKEEKLSNTSNKIVEDDVPLLDAHPTKKSNKTGKKPIDSKEFANNLPETTVAPIKNKSNKEIIEEDDSEIAPSDSTKTKNKKNKKSKKKKKKSKKGHKKNSRLEKRIRFLEAKLKVKTNPKSSLEKRVLRLEKEYLKRNP